jgi:hypothetical protein
MCEAVWCWAWDSANHISPLLAGHHRGKKGVWKAGEGSRDLHPQCVCPSSSYHLSHTSSPWFQCLLLFRLLPPASSCSLKDTSCSQITAIPFFLCTIPSSKNQVLEAQTLSFVFQGGSCFLYLLALLPQGAPFAFQQSNTYLTNSYVKFSLVT